MNTLRVSATVYIYMNRAPYMNSVTFRTILVLWLFLSVLVSISDPTDLDLTDHAVPAVLEYVLDLRVGETKFKDLSLDVFLTAVSMPVAADGILRNRRPCIVVLQSSAPPRYQLLSTYRI
jgi:hypothetical protein